MLVVLFEVVTRLAGVHFPAVGSSESDRALWSYDAELGWFHTPGTVGRSFLGGPDPGTVRINGLGLRGREVEAVDSPEVIRVVMLGDSFVFGVGVDERHLASTLLERRLNAERPGVHEVVNLGVSGYSTDQELLLLRRLGPRLAPDVVVLVVCDNDLEGNLLDFAYLRYYKPRFVSGQRGAELTGVPVPRLSAPQRAKLWLSERSNLWNALRSRYSPADPGRGAFGIFQVGLASPSDEDPVALTALLVREIREEALGLGARLLVASTGRRGEDVDAIFALRRALLDHGIRLRRLQGVLSAARAAAPERAWDFGADRHWNVDAHRLVADTLASELIEGGWLSD